MKEVAAALKRLDKKTHWPKSLKKEWAAALEAERKAIDSWTS